MRWILFHRNDSRAAVDLVHPEWNQQICKRQEVSGLISTNTTGTNTTIFIWAVMICMSLSKMRQWLATVESQTARGDPVYLGQWIR
jgi:hypothetical protein